MSAFSSDQIQDTSYTHRMKISHIEPRFHPGNSPSRRNKDYLRTTGTGYYGEVSFTAPVSMVTRQTRTHVCHPASLQCLEDSLSPKSSFLGKYGY